MPELREHPPTMEMKVAVLQRVCTPYRLPLFRALTATPGLHFRLFIGADIPNSKVQSASNLDGLDVVRLATRFIRIGQRLLVWHAGLQRELGEYQPRVIITEGESNLLNYLQAILYRAFNPGVALIHWSLGGMPGEPLVRRGPAAAVVRTLRRRFDAFIVYSSYGKQVLVENGMEAERIFVATNVSDLERHLTGARALSRHQARRELARDERFLVLFVGALTRYKRLEVLIEAMRKLDPTRFDCVIVGEGEVASVMRDELARNGPAHVHMVGKVSAGLDRYYRAADAMVLPGRGGMVISEAMAYALPVLAYQADGTEFDLIEQGTTGFRLARGDATEIAEVLESLAAEPRSAQAMGLRGQERVATRFTTAAMVAAVKGAINAAVSGRRRREERA